MGGRQGPSRRARLIGVLVVGLVLALSLPTVALAANVATFSYRVPASGSSSTNAQPTISTVVYDRYGVYGAYPTVYSMTIDGKAVKPTFSRYAGYGYRKFRLSYRPTTPLSSAIHTVVVKVKDLRGYTSTTSWRFRVDRVAPVTTANGALPTYAGSFFMWLSVADNTGGIGVANTYHQIDGGPVNTGSPVWGYLGLGSHTLKFWSVDKLGNSEATQTLSTTVMSRHATMAGFSATCGTPEVGCHPADLAMIHEGASCEVCHGTGVTPSNSCASCHTITTPMHVPHVAIESSSTAGETCTQAECHGTDVLKPHESCGSCHASASQAIRDVIAAGDAKCESCHTAGYGSIHSGATAAHVWSGAFACSNSRCHPSNVADVHEWLGATRCLACHGEGKTPSTLCGNCHTSAAQDAAHSYQHPILEGGAETNSAVCVSCHGSDIFAVLPEGNSVTGELEHQGCSCHAYGEAPAGQNKCQDCHSPHGFSQSVAPWDPANTWVPMGGHNTTMYDVNGGAEHFGEGGIIVKDSQGTTIEQHWPVPTSGVFWSQSKALTWTGTETTETPGVYSLNPTDSPDAAMAARKRVDGTVVDLSDAIRTDVGWDSVITCYDCHTELEGLEGPQGANEANYGLDPNFPDDWTRAELTSFDPTGMRSIATTQGSENRYYPKWGSRQWWPTNSEETTTKQLISGDPSTVATIYAGGSYEATSVSANGYSAGNVEGAFLCQKCHKLVNSYQGLAIEGNGSGFRSNNLAQIGFGNYPHMEHHGDMVTGQGNCVSCHVAIPHGWKRPRLLVYASDPAPYKTQWVYSKYRVSGATATDTVGAGRAGDPNADLNASIAATTFAGYLGAAQTQEGNWGWLGLNQYATSGAMYQPLNTTQMVNGSNTSTNPENAGSWPVLITANLDGLSAGVDSHKAIENPGVDEGRLFESTFNAQLPVQATGLQVVWSRWMWDHESGFGGVEWHSDDTPGANGYDGNPATPNTLHYNNCNGCTSASNNRHTPHNNGINPNVGMWK